MMAYWTERNALRDIEHEVRGEAKPTIAPIGAVDEVHYD